jgi:hypothetical protein
VSVSAICGEEALAGFRATWTGGRILDLLAELGGRMRVDWTVGVGKSHNLDQVIATAIEQQRYDLVVALLPTRQVIAERAWIISPPSGVRVVNLRPRPRERCGPVRDADWRHFEQRGLGALGRARLCGRCEHAERCYGPTQYGQGLAGTQVIFAAQAHLKRSPAFVDQCAQWAGAGRVLAILDETHFVMADRGQQIARPELERFLDVLERHQSYAPREGHRRWTYLSRLLTVCSTGDLRAPEWTFPAPSPDWALAIQTEGWGQYGTAFRYHAPDRQLLGRSAMESRERLLDGTLRFALPSDLDGDFLIYSAHTPHALIEHRLGQTYPSPFAHYRFEHPGSTWVNLASRIGMQRYYVKNAPQILDCFAQLIVRRIGEGRRVLGVAKKRLIPLCAVMLQERLAHYGLASSHVVEQPGPDADLSDPAHIPLIGYGAIGTNRYESYDCVFCLTGFYVSEAVLSATLQDMRASDFRVPMLIRTAGSPPRRIAEVSDPRHRIYDVAALAQAALDHLEMGTVLQAVGRVRPFTRPREVITFQCADHPTGAYDHEFTNLADMRRHFGLIDRRAAKGLSTAARVGELRDAGLAQGAVAEQLKIGLRTVQRYWQREPPSTRIEHLPSGGSRRMP